MDLASSMLEALSGTAKFKRLEQLKRWDDSDTNKESSSIKEGPRKINFSDGCVFLAACSSGDKDEVRRLIDSGADIDTANVDGLTALHQACIDDNLEMVEFLIEAGADVNKGDNEGWSPLHATASCGFISIARYLIEHGSNVAAVNNDGELPIDIAESDEMEELLQEEIDNQEIDCDAARNEEENLMVEDANRWLNSGIFKDRAHPKTGATALHVASAKGYIKVMSILIQAGANINAQDVDGWTPLHASAHWGQKEACEILVENLCDMDLKNFAGQTVFDVADPEMVKLLEELRKKQATLQKENNQSSAILDYAIQAPGKRNISITRMSSTDKTHFIGKDKTQDHVQIEPKPIIDGRKRSGVPSQSSESSDGSEFDDTEIEKRNKANEKRTRRDAQREDLVNKDDHNEQTRSREHQKQPAKSLVNETEEDIPVWRRGLRKNDNSASVEINNQSSEIIPRFVLGSRSSFPPNSSSNTDNANEQESERNDRRRPVSLESDERSYIPPVRDEESETQRKAHAKRVRETRRSTQGVTLEEVKSAEQLIKKQQENVDKDKETVRLDPKSETASGDRSSDALITKSKESTTDELERRPSWRMRSNNDQSKVSDDIRSPRRTRDSVGETLPTTDVPSSTPFIRRSRLPSDGDKPIPAATSSPTVSRTRVPKADEDSKDQDKENDGSLSSTGANIQATQAAIHRRRRPKRRSTGVVYPDMDDNSDGSQENKEESKLENKTDDNTDSQNSSERSFRSRYGSSGSITDAQNRSDGSASFNERLNSRSISGDSNDDNTKDYKRLYEDVKSENDRLREKLRLSENQSDDFKQRCEKLQALQRTSSNDAEKRERRALERKVSEMEEELKQMEQLKTDNQRLRDENGALIRVISKLSK